MKEMQEMLQTFMPYIMPLLTAIVGWICKTVAYEHKEQKLIKVAVIAILHDRLYKLCRIYIADKKITVEAMHNLKYLYEAYYALGGNGTGEELYNRCKKLTIIEGKEVDLK